MTQWSLQCLLLLMTLQNRVPAPEDPNNSRLFKAFSFNNSRPSSSWSFYSIQPYWYWRKNTPIWSIRAWRLLIISGLRQFFYPLNSNCGSKFSQSPSHQVLLKVSHRQIPNFSRPSTRFPKQFKDIFSIMKFKDFSRLALNSRPVQEPWQKCFDRLMESHIHRKYKANITDNYMVACCWVSSLHGWKAQACL